MLDATILSKMSFEELALTLWARQNNLEIVSVQYIPKEGMGKEQK